MKNTQCHRKEGPETATHTRPSCKHRKHRSQTVLGFDEKSSHETRKPHLRYISNIRRQKQIKGSKLRCITETADNCRLVHFEQELIGDAFLFNMRN